MRSEHKAIRGVVQGLARAWNTASGADLASYCDEDADFVNMDGVRACGREAIAAAHDYVLRTMYAGSTLEYDVKEVRFLAKDVALVHARARLQLLQGSMAGEWIGLPSMVLRQTDSGWSVALFHNALMENPPAEN